MNANNRIGSAFFVFLFVIISFLNQTFAQIERFMPRQGGNTEIWRITRDPTMRDHANYHNTDAWSPDGRYICYTHSEQYGRQIPSEVHIYDLYEDKDIKIDNGSSPRWANNHNWLIYLRRNPQSGLPDGRGTQIMWYDADTKKLTQIGYGVTHIGETDCGDRWIYGSIPSNRKRTPEDRINRNPPQERQGVRLALRENSRLEILEGLRGIQWVGNPKYPVVFVRYDHFAFPFGSTRTWFDPDGGNRRIGSPSIQRCHQSWLGDGSYHLHGGTPMTGRRWNEPFPSNLHILTAIGCGDISPCGKSGRWISGSGNRGSLQIADVRSGDGYNYLKAAFSLIHDSDKYSYCAGSALHNNDAKGSPDGTKIIFVSNYDLKDGPVTEITEDVSGISGDRIPVKSTDGFPETGGLSVGNEVIGYKRKTPISFEGLTRGLHHTTRTNLEGITAKVRKEFAERSSDEEFLKSHSFNILQKLKTLYTSRRLDLRKDTIISSFEVRCIPDALRKKMTMPERFTRADFPGRKDSPLMWQNRSDIYFAIVRLPDKPYLWKIDEKVELIPGENHWETYGYHLFKDGKKITENLVRPGTTFTLPGAGAYTAAAVEWSGLESIQSLPLQVNNTKTLKIRWDKPADFSWTYDRWLIDGKEVDVEKTEKSSEAVKEIVRLYDGVIHREWYNWGQIIKRYDLNLEGKPIRRLFYQNGKLARREYHNRDGVHVSTEHFDADGYITESILYRTVDGKSREFRHWWYERGMPIKLVGSAPNASPKGAGIYVKEGEKWVKKD